MNTFFAFIANHLIPVPFLVFFSGFLQHFAHIPYTDSLHPSPGFLCISHFSESRQVVPSFSTACQFKNLIYPSIQYILNLVLNSAFFSTQNVKPDSFQILELEQL